MNCDCSTKPFLNMKTHLKSKKHGNYLAKKELNNMIFTDDGIEFNKMNLEFDKCMQIYYTIKYTKNNNIIIE